MKFEDIAPKINDIKNILDFIEDEAKRCEEKIKQSEELNETLIDLSSKLDEKKKILENRSIELAQESAFNRKTLAEIRFKESLLDKRTVEVNTLNIEYDKKKTELMELNVELTNQITKRDALKKELDDKIVDITKREGLIAKETIIDRERKQNLDLLERKNKEREAYLQRVMQT